jgi:hypothetical protein
MPSEQRSGAVTQNLHGLPLSFCPINPHLKCGNAARFPADWALNVDLKESWYKNADFSFCAGHRYAVSASAAWQQAPFSAQSPAVSTSIP